MWRCVRSRATTHEVLKKNDNCMDRTFNIRPFKFVPYLRTVLWGGERIAQYKGIDTDLHQVGESWEISGVEGHESVVAEGEDKGLTLPELIDKYRGNLVGDSVYKEHGNQFPLLVKIIDAKRDLSLQVHPGDQLARQRHGCSGKTEMWYILDAEADAAIYAGLSMSITPADYRRMVADGSIMEAVARHSSHRGDLFFLPSGRIHAIGAGNFLVEIQQTSDITYRVYDYGRVDADGKPRELHTELAMDAIDYHVYDNYKIESKQETDGGVTELVKCKYFNTYKIIVDGAYDADLSHGDTFCVLMCLEGGAVITDNFGNIVEMRRGETVLVPAATSLLHIAGSATLLAATR